MKDVPEVEATDQASGEPLGQFARRTAEKILRSWLQRNEEYLLNMAAGAALSGTSEGALAYSLSGVDVDEARKVLQTGVRDCLQTLVFELLSVEIRPKQDLDNG